MVKTQNPKYVKQNTHSRFYMFFAVVLTTISGLLFYSAFNLAEGKSSNVRQNEGFRTVYSESGDGARVIQNEDSEVLGCTTINMEEDEIIFNNEVDRTWYLKGDELSNKPGTSADIVRLTSNISLTKPWGDFLKNDENFSVTYELVETGLSGNMLHARDVEGSNARTYIADIDISDLQAGSYKVKTSISTSCNQYVSPGSIAINYTYPIYVVWTMDWEARTVPRDYIAEMDRISKEHGDVPMTHFFNPRILEPSIYSPSNAQYYVNYVKSRRDIYGDEIALHLHMFPDMVEAAGVEPQTTPAWGWYTNDGYDVLVSGYEYDKMDDVLDWSVDKFEEYDLGRPTGFRAGGWFADEGTLRVLEDNGFVYDSSGRTAYEFGTNGVETHWNLQTTTQPYQSLYVDQNIAGGGGADTMQLWQMPNNGGESTGMEADEMIRRFNDNYKGGIVRDHTTVNYLSHPDYFNIDGPVMDKVFRNTSQYRYDQDKGPVVYTTIEEVHKVWEAKE